MTIAPKTYVHSVQIEFNHCDPFGIVFYPRYYEMLNSVVENFFKDVLDYPFARMHVQDGCGVPTVTIETQFKAPSRLGDIVDFTLTVVRVGRSSADLRIVATKDGEVRLTNNNRLVWIGADRRPAPWPEHLRAKLTAALGEEAA